MTTIKEKQTKELIKVNQQVKSCRDFLGFVHRPVKTLEDGKSILARYKKEFDVIP